MDYYTIIFGGNLLLSLTNPLVKGIPLGMTNEMIEAVIHSGPLRYPEALTWVLDLHIILAFSSDNLWPPPLHWADRRPA
jgi:hypothetical protein